MYWTQRDFISEWSVLLKGNGRRYSNQRVILFLPEMHEMEWAYAEAYYGKSLYLLGKHNL